MNWFWSIWYGAMGFVTVCKFLGVAFTAQIGWWTIVGLLMGPPLLLLFGVLVLTLIIGMMSGWR